MAVRRLKANLTTIFRMFGSRDVDRRRVEPHAVLQNARAETVAHASDALEAVTRR